MKEAIMNNLNQSVQKLKMIYLMMAMIDEGTDSNIMKYLKSEQITTENDIEKEVAKLKMAARNR